MEKFKQLLLLLFLIDNYNGILGIENEPSTAHPNNLPTTVPQKISGLTTNESVTFMVKKQLGQNRSSSFVQHLLVTNETENHPKLSDFLQRNGNKAFENKLLANFHELLQSNTDGPAIEILQMSECNLCKLNLTQNNGTFRSNDTEFIRNSSVEEYSNLPKHNNTREVKLEKKGNGHFQNNLQINTTHSIPRVLPEITKKWENVSRKIILNNNLRVDNIPRKLKNSSTDNTLSDLLNGSNKNESIRENKLNRNLDTFSQLTITVLKRENKSQVENGNVTLLPKLGENGRLSNIFNKSKYVNGIANLFGKNSTKTKSSLPSINNYLLNYLNLVGVSSKTNAHSIKSEIKPSLVLKDDEVKNISSSTPAKNNFYSNTLNSKFIRSIQGKRVRQAHTVSTDKLFSSLPMVQNTESDQQYTFPDAILIVVETAPYIFRLISHRNEPTHNCPNFQHHLEDYLVVIFDFTKCLHHIMNPESSANTDCDVCQNITDNYSQIMSLMRVIRECAFYTPLPTNESNHSKIEEIRKMYVGDRKESNYTQMNHPHMLQDSINETMSENNSKNTNPLIKEMDRKARNSRTKFSRVVGKKYHGTFNLRNEGKYKHRIDHNSPLRILDIASLKAVNEVLEQLHATIVNYVADYTTESNRVMNTTTQTEGINNEVIPSSIPFYTISSTQNPEYIDKAMNASKNFLSRKPNETIFIFNNFIEPLTINNSVNNLNVSNLLNVTETNNSSIPFNMSLVTDNVPSVSLEYSTIIGEIDEISKLPSNNNTAELNFTTTDYLYKTDSTSILNNSNSFQNSTKETEKHVTSEIFRTVDEIKQYKQLTEPVITIGTTGFVNITELSTEKYNGTLHRSRRHAGSEIINNIIFEPNSTATGILYPTSNESNLGVILNNTTMIFKDFTEASSEISTANDSFVGDINEGKRTPETFTKSVTEIVNSIEGLSSEINKTDNITESGQHVGSEMTEYSVTITIVPNFTTSNFVDSATTYSNLRMTLNDTTMIFKNFTEAGNEISTGNDSFLGAITQEKRPSETFTESVTGSVKSIKGLSTEIYKNANITKGGQHVYPGSEMTESSEKITIEPNFTTNSFVDSGATYSNLGVSFNNTSISGNYVTVQDNIIIENVSVIDDIHRQITESSFINSSTESVNAKDRSLEKSNNDHDGSKLHNILLTLLEKSELHKVLRPNNVSNIVGHRMDNNFEIGKENKPGSEQNPFIANIIDEMKNMMDDTDDLSKIENLEMVSNISLGDGGNRLLKSFVYNNIDEPQNMKNIDMAVESINTTPKDDKASSASFYYYTITLPTFFGLIVGIAVMCLILRTGGSCCNLLREQPHPLAEDNLEEENEKLRQSSDGDHESSTMLKKQQIV